MIRHVNQWPSCASLQCPLVFNAFCRNLFYVGDVTKKGFMIRRYLGHQLVSQLLSDRCPILYSIIYITSVQEEYGPNVTKLMETIQSNIDPFDLSGIYTLEHNFDQFIIYLINHDLIILSLSYLVKSFFGIKAFFVLLESQFYQLVDSL